MYTGSEGSEETLQVTGKPQRKAQLGRSLLGCRRATLMPAAGIQERRTSGCWFLWREGYGRIITRLGWVCKVFRGLDVLDGQLGLSSTRCPPIHAAGPLCSSQKQQETFFLLQLILSQYPLLRNLLCCSCKGEIFKRMLSVVADHILKGEFGAERQ